MIKKYTCSNGVRILLEKIPTVRSVSIGIWIKTGSRYENKNNNGISHFLEHMLFKGTKTRSAMNIAESFDRIGGQVNAFTSKEYTCYYAKVLDNHASFALEVLADMFFNSRFQKTELEKEKNVVKEEIKMYEDTPDDIVHDLLSKEMYKNSPLSYSILGTQETLNNLKKETLNDYINTNYTPDRIVISVAGNIDDSFIKEIEQQFGNYIRNKNQIKKSISKFQSGIITKKREIEQSHLCLAFPGLQLGHKDIYSLIILNNILGGSMSSRLFQEVREKRGLAYSIFSYHSSYEDTGALTIYAGTSNDQLKILLEILWMTLLELKNNGITDREITNSKEQLKGNLMLGLESTNARMNRNGKNELLLGYHLTLDEVINKIDKVSKDSVNQMIKNIFNDQYATSLISSSGKMPSLQNTI